MARRAWSKLETGGGGRRNWPAKNDPYKYAAAIETGPRLPKRRFSSFAIPIGGFKIQTERRRIDHNSIVSRGLPNLPTFHPVPKEDTRVKI